VSDEHVMLTDELRARVGQTRAYTAPSPSAPQRSATSPKPWAT
jgi:hypothetical protein